MHRDSGSGDTRYTPEFERRVEAWARAQIPAERQTHVEGVVASADALARRYAPADVARARLAGWIHDAAKHWPDADLLAYAGAHGLPVSEGERQAPMLLHGLVGYHLAAGAFGLEDPALRDACARHTTGDAEMTALDKVVYLADLIEPGRTFPGVEALRAEVERDLDGAMLLAVDHTLRHLIDKRRLIDPRAVLLRNRLIDSGVRYGDARQGPNGAQ